MVLTDGLYAAERVRVSTLEYQMLSDITTALHHTTTPPEYVVGSDALARGIFNS
jgi:hypothetical protein